MIKKFLGVCFNLLMFGFIGAVIFIIYFNKCLAGGLITCAEEEVKRISVIVINNSVKKYISDNSIVDDLIDVEKDETGRIKLMRYNTKVLNEIEAGIESVVEEDLSYMTKGEFKKINFKSSNISSNFYEFIEGGVLFSISIGNVTRTSLLANVGPKIPLKLSLVGRTESKIETDVREYGLNNAYLEVSVNVISHVMIQMPFMSKSVKISKKVPIDMEIIQGELPSYYINN